MTDWRISGIMWERACSRRNCGTSQNVNNRKMWLRKRIGWICELKLQVKRYRQGISCVGTYVEFSLYPKSTENFGRVLCKSMTWSTVLSPSPLLNSIPKCYTSVIFKVCSDDLEVPQNPKMPSVCSGKAHMCWKHFLCLVYLRSTILWTPIKNNACKAWY